jgi:hypothetical protein
MFALFGEKKISPSKAGGKRPTALPASNTQ